MAQLSMAPYMLPHQLDTRYTNNDYILHYDFDQPSHTPTDDIDASLKLVWVASELYTIRSLQQQVHKLQIELQSYQLSYQ